MHPELFGSLPAYAIFLIVGDLVGIAVAVYCARHAGLDTKRFAIALFTLTVSAFVGAKFYGLIERGGSIGTASAELFGGYRYPGGVIAVAVGALVVGRLVSIPAGALADVVAPAFGFAMSTVRVGCLLAGCCSGQVCTMPWGIRFPAHSQVWEAQVQAGLLAAHAPVSLPVHPLQVYFSIVSFGLGCFLLWFERRKAYDGQCAVPIWWRQESADCPGMFCGESAGEHGVKVVGVAGRDRASGVEE